MPYVFQLFAALLEARPQGPLSDYYRGLIGPILSPNLWESRGNVPALSRLLASIIPRAALEIVANNQIEAILGIFQKLMAGRVKTELFAYDILEAVVTSCKVTDIQQYFPTILSLLFTRLMNNPPEKFKQRFVRFYYLVTSLDEPGYGADFFIKNADAVQEGVYTQLYLAIILPTTQQLIRPSDRKLAVVALTKTLTDSQAFAQKYSKAGWGKSCEALLKILENPPMPVSADDIVVEVDVDDLSFGVGFTPLNTCGKKNVDYWPEITDVKSWVGAYLKTADARHNGAIAQYVNQRLSPEAKSVLLSYMG